MMRIDAHVHFVPPATDDTRTARARAEPYLALLQSSGGPQGYASAARMLADADAAQIDQLVVLGLYPQQHASCVMSNTATLDLAQQYPQRIIPFVVLQPLAGVAAHEELRRAVAAGARGVGELSPYAQGYGWDDPAFLALVEACLAHDLPLNIHINAPVGRNYPGKVPTAPQRAYELAVRYPKLQLILAHWGGGLLFYEIIPQVAAALANVCYDTAASPLTYPTAAIVRAALACVSPHKILYGSDYPLLLTPRASREPAMTGFAADLAACLPDFASQQAVFGGNMIALLEQVGARMPAQRDVPRAPLPPVSARTPVALLAAAQPTARDVLHQHKIPWQIHDINPFEPLSQAAAARGMDSAGLATLLEELREAGA